MQPFDSTGMGKHYHAETTCFFMLTFSQSEGMYFGICIPRSTCCKVDNELGVHAMAHSRELEEQRRHRRFEAPYGAVAALRHKTRSKIGLITDISRGGLAFSYIGNNIYYTKPPRKKLELDILLGAKNFYLDKVGCRIVLDHIPPGEKSTGIFSTKKCRIQFVELTSFQKSQVDFFIDNFTHDPASDIPQYL